MVGQTELVGKRVTIVVDEGSPPFLARSLLEGEVVGLYPMDGPARNRGVLVRVTSPRFPDADENLVGAMERYLQEQFNDAVRGIPITVNIILVDAKRGEIAWGIGTLRISIT